jgi:HSP20 family molecular chaperone IbpA
MRMRYRTVLFHIEDGEDLRQHYQQLIDELMRQTQTTRPVSRSAATWRPPIDIYETPEAYVVKVELAGMAEEEIEVTLYTDAVMVSGTRQNDSLDEEGVSFHEAQIRYGLFQAAIPLPTPIEREGAEARYNNGFLRLRLPKKPPERLRVQGEREVTAPAIAPSTNKHNAAERETPGKSASENGGVAHV